MSLCILEVCSMAMALVLLTGLAGTAHAAEPSPAAAAPAEESDGPGSGCFGLRSLLGWRIFPGLKS